MKTCPNCKELIGDSAASCFNCKYNFFLNRVATKEDEIDGSEIKKSDWLENLKNRRHLTTGYNFEGYSINNYLGTISGESVLGTGFLSEFKASISDTFGVTSKAFSDKLKYAKNKAIDSMIESCIFVGGNAIIGISFDYLNFSNNLIGVVANGTAVIINKK